MELNFNSVEMSREPRAEACSLDYAETKLTVNSVETIPSLNASAAFQVDSGKEYGAFSCSIRDKEMIISYINKQRIHHATRTFEQEYREMIERSGLEWNDYRLT